MNCTSCSRPYSDPSYRQATAGPAMPTSGLCVACHNQLMCEDTGWGGPVQAGWMDLVYEARDLCTKHGVRLAQVKEKFGDLRIYTEGATEQVSREISAICVRSSALCEDCGRPGSPHQKGSWMRTLCRGCAVEQGAVKSQATISPLAQRKKTGKKRGS